MKDDLSKYMPDVGKVIEESRPELVKARRRKAVEKLVDAGLIDRATPAPAAVPAPAARTSAPSPWAKDGGAGARIDFDREALPSAAAPAAVAPAEERPVTK